MHARIVHDDLGHCLPHLRRGRIRRCRLAEIQQRTVERKCAPRDPFARPHDRRGEGSGEVRVRGDRVHARTVPRGCLRCKPLDAHRPPLQVGRMAQPPILTLSDIALTFGGDPLFTQAALIVQPGDRVCLVGRNGSGKSTLMKIMAGMIEPDAGQRFLRPGMQVSYMDQDPDFTGYDTLGDFAMEGLELGMEWKVYAAAEGLKLALERDPAQASGGERRRAALAKLLAAEPDLMLLDEPTNHLDIQAIGWLEEHLKATRSAFVMISHDRTFLRELTRATLWVDRGVVRRLESGFEAFEDWRDKTFEEEDMQRHKLNRLIKEEARWAVEGISARRKRNQGRVRRLGELRDERSSQIRRQGTAAMGFKAGSKSGRLVVEATDVTKVFGDTVIVEDFSIRVMRGERLALVGPNGEIGRAHV